MWLQSQTFNLCILPITFLITWSHLIEHGGASLVAGSSSLARLPSKSMLEVGKQAQVELESMGGGSSVKKLEALHNSVTDPAEVTRSLPKGERRVESEMASRKQSAEALGLHQTRVSTASTTAKASPGMPLSSYLQVKSDLQALSSIDHTNSLKTGAASDLEVPSWKTYTMQYLEIGQSYLQSFWQRYKEGFKRPDDLEKGAYSKQLPQAQTRPLHNPALDADISKEVSKRLSLINSERDTILVPDVSNPTSWKELSTSGESYREAINYATAKLGAKEFFRRMRVSRAQYREMRNLLQWDEQIATISTKLEIPAAKVKEAGEKFGGKNFFPSFEDVDPTETLQALANLKKNEPLLYMLWEAFLGLETLERRVGLLKALERYGSQGISGNQLSAWQMQGMDVERMLNVLYLSKTAQAQKVQDKALTELVLLEKPDRLDEVLDPFVAGTRQYSNWGTTVEHDQLLHTSPDSNQYKTVQASMEKIKRERVFKILKAEKARNRWKKKRLRLMFLRRSKSTREKKPILDRLHSLFGWLWSAIKSWFKRLRSKIAEQE